jgi:hypothetical protein
MADGTTDGEHYFDIEEHQRIGRLQQLLAHAMRPSEDNETDALVRVRLSHIALNTTEIAFLGNGRIDSLVLFVRSFLHRRIQTGAPRIRRGYGMDHSPNHQPAQHTRSYKHIRRHICCLSTGT